MKLDKNYLLDLIYYTKQLQKILSKLPLNKKLYKEGTTVGQILFHTTQVINYWFRVIMLDLEYARNRDLEFKNQPTDREIKSSLKKALEICESLPSYKLPLDKKIRKPIVVEPANFKIDTVLGVLFHITVHTAEHWGELHLLAKK